MASDYASVYEADPDYDAAAGGYFVDFTYDISTLIDFSEPQLSIFGLC